LPSDDDVTDLQRRLEGIRLAAEGSMVECAVVSVDAHHRAIEQFLAAYDPSIQLIALPPDMREGTLQRCLQHVHGQFVACVPPKSSVHGLKWPVPSRYAKSLRPLIGDMCLPLETASASAVAPIAWIASRDALDELRPEFQPSSWTLDDLALAFSQSRSPVKVLSAEIPSQAIDGGELKRRCSQESTSRILVIIPHFRCEQWLDQCLFSILSQTRSPEGIVVVDDGSPEPPIDVVDQYPEVTLVAAEANVGP
jgi:hypothetical protein